MSQSPLQWQATPCSQDRSLDRRPFLPGPMSPPILHLTRQRCEQTEGALIKQQKKAVCYARQEPVRMLSVKYHMRPCADIEALDSFPLSIIIFNWKTSNRFAPLPAGTSGVQQQSSASPSGWTWTGLVSRRGKVGPLMEILIINWTEAVIKPQRSHK